MPDEVLPAVVPADNHPLALARLALEKGNNPADLKALYELASQMARDRAAERFAYALTDFQAAMPAVYKARHASGGKMAFAFASLDDVMKLAGPLLAKNQIVVTYTTEAIEATPPAASSIKTICRVRVGTHVEETTVTVPVPVGIVNNTQLYGQAITYGKRYALCAALGIVITDEDQDAAGLIDTVSEQQLDQIEGLLNACLEAGKPVDITRFLSWVDAESLAKIPAAAFPKVMAELKRKLANGGKRP